MIKIDVLSSAGNQRGSRSTGTAGSCSSGIPAAQLMRAEINPPLSYLCRLRWNFVLDALSAMPLSPGENPSPCAVGQ